MLVLKDWLLTPARVAVHLPSATAVVADLHLGYGEARQRGGDAVPLADVSHELAALQALLQKQSLRQLIIAGDLFEAGARAELVDALISWCEQLYVELAIVPGNHDRGIERWGERLRLHPEGVTLGSWRVVHGDRTLPAGALVQGHAHPWARWGRNLSGPCFLVSETRLILPAYSRDAAGVNVLSDPRWTYYRCCVIAGEQVLDFGEVSKLGMRAARNN